MCDPTETLTPLLRRSRSARDCRAARGSTVPFFDQGGIVAKAVEHLCELMFDEMRQKVEQIPVDGPLYQAWLELVIASRTGAYLRDSIRAVNARLTESVEKTLSGLFAPSTSSVPNLDLPPVMFFFMIEGLAVGAEVREKRVIEQVLAAAKNICGELFTPRSAEKLPNSAPGAPSRPPAKI